MLGKKYLLLFFILSLQIVGGSGFWFFVGLGVLVADYLFVKEGPVKKQLEGTIVGTATVIITAVAHVPKNPIDGLEHIVDLATHPIRGDFAYAMHECCVEHDSCYARLGVTQDECDETFCKCQKVATGGSECEALGDSFCNLVRRHGESSYDEAQEKTKAKMKATTATKSFTCDFLWELLQCPELKNAMHECCVEHDSCYARLGVTQDECDKTFCKCQKLATEGSGCAATADMFCYWVKDHGKAFYDEAQEKTKSKM
uniref:Phospholipase A2 n=1 Tax=Globodera pallida TaxID=36090 RepID=A0A183BMW2_GLOPA